MSKKRSVSSTHTSARGSFTSEAQHRPPMALPGHAMGNDARTLTWTEAAEYLVAAKAVPAVPASAVEFAHLLRDGTRLCRLVQTLSKKRRMDYNKRPKREFLCLENIHRFLDYCHGLGLSKDTLFEAEDLFNGHHFERVVATLSKLSATEVSTKSGLRPFPAERRQSQAETEDVYENISELLEKMDTAVPIDTTVAGAPPVQRGSQALALSAESNEEVKGSSEEAIYSSVVRSSHYGDLKRKAKQRSERRMCCYQELVETERNFLECLRITDDFYRKPLLALLESGNHNLPSDADVSVVFRHLDPLLSLHARILGELEQRSGQDGSVFVQHRDDLLMYAEYCVDLPRAKAVMEHLSQHRDVGAALKDMQYKSRQKFPLKDLLSVPMQRVLRYPLLLKELVRLTPEEDPRKEQLQAALSTTQDVAKHVDECKHDIENFAIVQQLEQNLKDYVVGTSGCAPLVGHGRLLIDGDVKLRLESDGRAARRYIFLFQRIMLVCKAKNTGYHFFFSMNLKDFHIEPEWVKGAKIGIKLTTKIPSAMAFNSTLIFKSTATRDTWEELLHHAKAESSLDAPKHSKGGTHYFLIHSFERASACDQCSLLLWGKHNQGLRCRYCHYSAHRQCLELVDPACDKSPKNQSMRDLLQRPRQSVPSNEDGKSVEPSLRRRLATSDKASNLDRSHPRNAAIAARRASMQRMANDGTDNGIAEKEATVRPPPEKQQVVEGGMDAVEGTAAGAAETRGEEAEGERGEATRAPDADVQERREAKDAPYRPSDMLTEAADETVHVGDRLYAVHSFHKRRDSRRGDLDFRRGDYIELLDKSSPHWWQGRHEKTDNVGMFPVSFCRVVTPIEPKLSSMPQKLSSGALNAHTTASLGSLSGIPVRSSSQLMHTGPMADPYSPTKTFVKQVVRREHLNRESSQPAPPVPPKSKHVQQQMMAPPGVGQEPSEDATGLAHAGVGSGDDSPPPLAARQQPSTTWYVGKLSRKAAEEHFLLARDGSFVVRQSANADNAYVITLKHKAVVRHLRIVHSGRGYLLGTSKVFPSIPELVTHFQRESLQVHFPDIDTPLLVACGTREFVESLPRFRAMYSFTAQADDELSFEEGNVVEVVHKSGFGDGWWLGRTSHGEGLVPGTYLEPMDSLC